LRPHLAFLLIYVLLSMYIANFYVSNGITMGKDGGAFFLMDWNKATSEEIYVWHSGGHGGESVYDYIYSPFYVFLAVFHGLGIGTVAFIYWFLVFIFAFGGAYLLCGRIIDLFDLQAGNQKNLACFLVSLAFVLSPIAVVYRWGDCNTQSMAYGLFPLFCYLMIDMVFEKSFRAAAGKALFCSLFMSIFGFGLVNVGLVLVPLSVILFNLPKVNWKHLFSIALLMTLFLSWVMIGYFARNIWLGENPMKSGDGGGPYGYAFREDWGFNYYGGLVDPQYPLFFYPVRLYDGLTAYAGYYQNTMVMGLWALFVILIFAATIYLGTARIVKKQGSLRYLAFCLVVFFFAYNLSVMPKGLFSSVYEMFVRSPNLLWNLKSAFDRFNFFLQFSLIPLSLDFVLFAISQKQRLVKTTLLMFFILAVFVSGFPLLSGQSALGAFDKGSTRWKANPSDTVLSYLDELEHVSTPASDFFILDVPSVKGSWIYTSWYGGYDYLAHSPGRDNGYAMDGNTIQQEINSLMESGTFAVDEKSQARLYDLLRLGNYRYVVLRGDVNLTNQNNWPGNPDIRNQVMNLFAFVDRYNLTVVYDDLDICRSRSFVILDKVPKIATHDDHDYHDDNSGGSEGSELHGEAVFRGLESTNSYRPYLKIVVGDGLTVIYKQGEGIYLRQKIGTGSATSQYWSSEVPKIRDLDWQNLSFETPGSPGGEPVVKLNGNEIRMEQAGPDFSEAGLEWTKEQNASILLNSVVIERCGKNCTTIMKADFGDDNVAGQIELHGSGKAASECPFKDPTAGYRMYENPDVAGGVFSIDGKSKNVTKTSYRFINPTEFVVSGQVPGDKLLVLSETYAPGWEARLFKNNQLVMREKPLQYEKLTAFNLSNLSGSGDYDQIVIRYGPEDLADISRGVSGFSWFCCLAILLFWHPPGDGLPRASGPDRK